MDITAKAWQIFIAKLRRVNEAAAHKILAYLTARYDEIVDHHSLRVFGYRLCGRLFGGKIMLLKL